MTIHLASTTVRPFLPATQEELVIFCVGQELRRVAAFRAWATHRRLRFRSLVGSYNGITEMSFVVAAAHYPEVAPWTRAEESILHLAQVTRNATRPAMLIFADGRSEDLGYFIACPRDTALASPSWTYDPATDEYFVCVKDTVSKGSGQPAPYAEPGDFHSTGTAS